MCDKLNNISVEHIRKQNAGLYPDQKSKKWITTRLNMLTASVCATALDCNTYESSGELLTKKVLEATEVIENRSNSNMDWGNKYENIAKSLYESLFSTAVYNIGLVTHPLYKWLGASPDGIMLSGKLLEIKCPVNRKVGEVPYYYWIQTQIQMEVCNLDLCDFMDCEFAECSEEQYNLIDGGKTIKGIILPTEKQNNSVCKISNIMDIMKEELKTKQYWIIKNYSIHTIKRDKVWFKNNINYLKLFWDKVINYREKGQKQLHDDTLQFVYHHSFKPIPTPAEVSSPRQRRSKRSANVLQDDPETILPNFGKVLSHRQNKRPCFKLDEKLIHIEQTGELIDWNTWVSATKTRNYIIEDPLIDWLEYHGNQYMYLETDECENDILNKSQIPEFIPRKGSEILRANYDVGDKFKIDLRNSMLFTSFLKENGVKFEKYVMQELFSRFSNDSLIVANEYQSRSIRKYEETVNAMHRGIPIIYHGVLHNHKNRTYGMPDLIVRSDWLNKIFSETIISEKREKDKARNLRLQPNESWHYRIVDIKFTTLNLRANGKYLLKDSNVEAIKSQLYVYNMALREIQGYNPSKSYIIGRKWQYKKNNVISSGDGWFDRVGHINFKTTDMHIRKETKDALKWIRKVRNYGHTFTVNPPSCPEMYPNMCNGLDGPWRRVKEKIAKEIFEITSLWQCGLKNRKVAHSKGVFGWDNRQCIAKTLGFNGDKISAILQQLLDCNQNSEINISGGEKDKENTLDLKKSYKKIILPTKIQSNDLRLWHGLKNIYKNKKHTLFVDFETTQNLSLDSDLNEPSNIFMIGIVYRDIPNPNYLYKCFYANDLTKQEELKVFLEFHKFVWNFAKKKKGVVILPDLIHWSPAERTFYNACWNKHGEKVIEAGYCKIYTWRDMLKVFRDEPITIRGSLNFSLKSVAKAFHKHGFIKTIWDDSECADGMSAMILALKCYTSVSKGEMLLGSSKDIMAIPTMSAIRSYNEVDCRVMQEIMTYLVQHH